MMKMKFLADMGISLRTEVLNNCQQDLEAGAIISVNNESFRGKKTTDIKNERSHNSCKRSIFQLKNYKLLNSYRATV